MDNYRKLTKQVNLSSVVRPVICILVILSIGHSLQVSLLLGKSHSAQFKSLSEEKSLKPKSLPHAIAQLQCAEKEIESAA